MFLLQWKDKHKNRECGTKNDVNYGDMHLVCPTQSVEVSYYPQIDFGM